MKEIDRKIAIIVKYVGPTNTKGSRVKMTLPTWSKSKTIPYNYEFSYSPRMAAAWLAENGVIAEGEMHLGDSYALYVGVDQFGALCKSFGLEK